MAVILIVEDEITYRTLIANRLTAAGHSVLLANDGIEATKMMAHWKERAPSLVITDQRMPGLSGYEVIRVLRAEPALHAIPVLMLTAFPGMVQDIVDLEGVKLLDKMTVPDAIMAEIEKLLELNPSPAPLPGPTLCIERGYSF